MSKGREVQSRRNPSVGYSTVLRCAEETGCDCINNWLDKVLNVQFSIRRSMIYVVKTES